MKINVPKINKKLIFCIFTFYVSFELKEKTLFNYSMSANAGEADCIKGRVIEKKLVLVNDKSDAHRLAEAFVIADTLLMIIVPLIAIIISYSSLMYILRNGIKRSVQFSRKDSKESRIDERQTTQLVLMILAVFFMLNLPSAILHIVHFTYKFRTMNQGFYNAAAITNSLVITEKSINCLLYCLFSRTFRRKLLQLITCQKANKDIRNFPFHVNRTALPTIIGAENEPWLAKFRRKTILW